MINRDGDVFEAKTDVTFLVIVTLRILLSAHFGIGYQLKLLRACQVKSSKLSLLLLGLLSASDKLFSAIFHSFSTRRGKPTEGRYWTKSLRLSHPLHPLKSISARAKRGWGLHLCSHIGPYTSPQRGEKSDSARETEMKEKKWKITSNMTALMSFTIRSH